MALSVSRFYNKKIKWKAHCMIQIWPINFGLMSFGLLGDFTGQAIKRDFLSFSQAIVSILYKFVFDVGGKVIIGIENGLAKLGSNSSQGLLCSFYTIYLW